MFYKLIRRYSQFNFFLLNKLQIKNFTNNYSYFYKFINLNDFVWQEGLMIDFLQKKIADNWIKKFLVYSSNLFNDRLVFDKIIKFYLILFVWPLGKIFFVDAGNVSHLLSFFIFTFIIVYLILIFFLILIC
jgi:hypothetical protein